MCDVNENEMVSVCVQAGRKAMFSEKNNYLTAPERSLKRLRS